MRKYALWGLIGLTIVLAADLAWAEGLKIAYVEGQRILDESEAGQKMRKELEKLMRTKEVKLREMVAELNKLDEELTRRQLVLSGEGRKKIEEELQRKELEIKRYREDSLYTLKKFRRNSLKEVNDASMKIIKKIGKQDNYSFIFEAREANMLYMDAANDITNRVIKLYDEEFERAKNK